MGLLWSLDCAAHQRAYISPALLVMLATPPLAPGYFWHHDQHQNQHIAACMCPACSKRWYLGRIDACILLYTWHINEPDR